MTTSHSTAVRAPQQSRRSRPAQGPPRVREPRQHPHALTTLVLTDSRCADVSRDRVREQDRSAGRQSGRWRPTWPTTSTLSVLSTYQ